MTPLQAFFAGDFATWRASAHPAPPLWLFVHVPKTAGSSLAAEIATDVAPYRSLHIDHLDRSRPALARYDTVVEQALEEFEKAPFRFASGHVQQRQVARLVQGVPGTRLFTMLRDPAARLVSDYLYQRSEMHPLAEEVRRRIQDFDAFLDLPGQRNRAARHLVPKPILDAQDAAAAIAHIEANYAFLGLQESYALGFRALTALLGAPRAPAARLRVNAAAAAERAEIAARLSDPALAARIAEANGLDLAIYRYFGARWDAIARRLESWLDGLG
ncbi:sulfotransferase family 2 domain-containing protein [Falsiroseomonas tokyonensis]|uniref:Sulfotransferase family 2 domain-containing protein n=1 Tax=Falsiroseomonas tokyonensis TaxID=430521 RepID=A0ABV7BVP9_9PROT|nr:sulfotransferase family 2 domain-containing protein [Falsiroseomonas tokyonensis]MBU8538108.1 sulfotransferase family 2 domain-containing protein [Falsiroseomonas tokyonensis]